MACIVCVCLCCLRDVLALFYVSHCVCVVWVFVVLRCLCFALLRCVLLACLRCGETLYCLDVHIAACLVFVWFGLACLCWCG